ncbi:MAG: colanic acid biosynthesis acetyltransferase WcaF [Xanthomonadales bacterium]|nr:colanic acid biosynthesis acetyltransferase WcaF [Xanthomonadales bacterium]
MKLDQYNNSNFDRGKPWAVEALWRVIEGILFSSWLPGSGWRRICLRVFGATIGQGVVIKPRVRIKFPWRLTIGDHSWIGESVWIDNLARVSIGDHCCISQGVYICTGSHRWDKSSFDLEVKPVKINNQVWICANSTVAPGVTLMEGSVLTLASLANCDCDAWTIYSGVPASKFKPRQS